MDTFEKSFVQELEKIALELSKTNVLNTPIGTPKTVKSYLGDALAQVAGGGAGALGGAGLAKALGGGAGQVTEGSLLGAALGVGGAGLLRMMRRQNKEYAASGVKPRFGRLGSAAIGAVGGGLLGALASALSAKGVDPEVISPEILQKLDPGNHSPQILQKINPGTLEKLPLITEGKENILDNLEKIVEKNKSAAGGAALGGGAAFTLPGLLGLKSTKSKK